MNKEKIEKAIDITKRIISGYVGLLGFIYLVLTLLMFKSTEQVWCFTYLGDDLFHFGMLTGFCGFCLIATKNTFFIEMDIFKPFKNIMSVVAGVIAIAIAYTLGIVELQLYHDAYQIDTIVVFLQFYFSFGFLIEIGVIIKGCELIYNIYCVGIEILRQRGI